MMSLLTRAKVSRPPSLKKRDSSSSNFTPRDSAATRSPDPEEAEAAPEALPEEVPEALPEEDSEDPEAAPEEPPEVNSEKRDSEKRDSERRDSERN